jgi:hypothetical protein
MFKAVIAASHPEFSSIRQHVLCLYYNIIRNQTWIEILSNIGQTKDNDRA